MNARGSILLSSMVMVLLAAAALALLTQTVFHLRILRGRDAHRQQLQSLERPLMAYLHGFQRAAAEADFNALGAVDADTLAGIFPEPDEPGLSRSLRVVAQSAARGSKKFAVTNDIRSACRQPDMALAAQAAFDILDGEVPLSEFPLLLNRPRPESAARFLEENGVRLAGGDRARVEPVAVSFDAAEFLLDALKISGQIPDWRLIREKLGLAPADEPPAPGVYLSREGERSEAIFVQGNLERLVFSIVGTRQRLLLTQGGRDTLLEYTPGESGFYFEPPGAEEPLRFGEKILVNGDVAALAQEGEYAFLENARLQLLSAGSVRITSNLNARHLQALPQQTILSSLLIATAASSFVAQEQRNADIVFAGNSPLDIEAQIMTPGAVVNLAPELRLTGTLYAGELRNGGQMTVAYRTNDWPEAGCWQAIDYRLLKRFRVPFIKEEEHE